MLTHYVKIAIRNLWKHRLQTIICLIGLSVGMTCFALSSLWLAYLESFEDFVPDADRIYMLSNGNSTFKPDYTDYQTPCTLGPKLKSMFPEIEETVWIELRPSESSVKVDDVEYKGLNIYSTSREFANFYQLNILYGAEPRDIKDAIITLPKAMELFGEENAVGKTLKLHQSEEEREVTICAVVEALPHNTQWHFDLLVRVEKSYSVATLVRFHKGVDVNAFQEKTTGTKYMITYPWQREEVEETLKINYLPLRELRSDYQAEWHTFKTSYVRLFMGIGLAVVICALCNYFITLICQIRIRSREYALRRLIGSNSFGIVGMNILETVLLFIIASVIGTILMFVAYPYFTELSQVEMPRGEMLSRGLIYIFGVTILSVIITSITTYIILRTNQRSILSGHQSHKSSSKLERVGSIVQLILSITATFCTIVMILQLRFLRNSNEIGFERANIAVLSNVNEEIVKLVLESPELVDTLYDGGKYYPLFPQRIMYSTHISPDASSDVVIHSEIKHISLSVVRFWGLEIIDGVLPTFNSNEVMINESMAQELNRDSIIGTSIYLANVNYGQSELKIVGIIKNQYLLSPTVEAKPSYYVNSDFSFYSGNKTLMFKTGNMEDLYKVIDRIHQKETELNIWEDLSVVATEYENQLTTETSILTLLYIISGASLLVSIFGIFSLVSLVLQQRKKEIALRKVHGATIYQVLSIFIKSNIYDLLISASVAFSIGYILMNDWLETYVKHVTLPLYLYPAILLVMAIIVIITIIWKIWSAVRVNPSEVIKNE